jgi:hypothetical protein
MSTTVIANFLVPVAARNRVLAAPMMPDFSGDFSADFAPAHRGIAAIEAGMRLHRDTAAGAEAPAAARADPTIQREALSLAPANANFALTNSASGRADARFAGEFAASTQFQFDLPLRGEWLVAQRSDNPAPAERLRRALADAVVRGEGMARMFLDPPMPTEQNSAASACLLLLPAESGALLPGDSIVPVESRSTAAFNADALLPIEALTITRVDSPACGELTGSLRGDATAGLERLAQSRADGTAPVAAATLWLLDAPLPAEFARRLTGDYPLDPETGAAVAGDSQALLELLRSLGIDTGPPIETAAAGLLDTGAALPIEILRVSGGDAPVAAESADTYVVLVTLTLSDGRVISFVTRPTAAT